ncbi:MAG: MMPL family transporter [Nocardioides sp.]
MNRLTRFGQRYPYRTVAAWLILMITMLPLALSLEDRLKAGGFEDSDGESAQTARTLQQSLGDPPNTLQIVVHTATGTATQVRAAVREATAVARDTPHVAGITTWRDDSTLEAEDGRTSLIVLRLDSDNTTTQNLVEDLRDQLGEATNRGVRVNVTGAPALDYDLNAQSKADAARAELIAFPLLFIVLLIIFRSIAAMTVPLLLAGMTLVITQGLGSLVTRVTDLSILYTNGVSLIGLAVAVDYSLFVIKRYRDEVETDTDLDQALATAMATAGRAVVFSGLAVLVALSTLLIPQLMVFSSIALAGGLVTLVALAISLTLLPAVLTLLGRRIDWGTLPRLRRARRRAPISQTSYLRSSGDRRRPAAILGAVVVGLVAMAWPITDITLRVPVASASILPADADSRQGIEALRSSLGTETLFPIVLAVSGDNDKDVQRTAETLVTLGSEIDGVTDAVADGRSGTDPDSGATVTRVSLFTSYDPDSPQAHDLLQTVRSELPAVGNVRISVGGATAGGADFDQVVIDSVPLIIGAVTATTFLLLGWAFRSWRLPALALVLNGLVVGAALGFLTLVGDTVLDEEVNSVTPVLLFAIMFGLSMDYLVIMISRMGEHFANGASHQAAIRHGLRATAGLVNGAAVIMVAVFASFMSAEISIVRQLGLGLAVAVLLDAVIVRMVLMPAALQVLGPRVWGRLSPPAHDSGPQAADTALQSVSELAGTR